MELHPAALDDELLASQCEQKFVRRSGPGGQHRNKVSTGVVLKHLPTGIIAEASERRSQVENRRVALRRLREKLALGVRHPIGRIDAPPSPIWQHHLREGRIRIAPSHAEYPALIAEALDRLECNQWDPVPTARQLRTTPSQLIRLLRRFPPALALVNTHRRRTGLAPLR
ncbi:MAG: peptide chain release factor-like protein [Planctomycetota bacterium]|nr:MAG: peptide chain release factor-like protein [Planctomycetota bacterium]